MKPLYQTQTQTLAAGAESGFQADRFLRVLASTGTLTIVGTGANDFGSAGASLPPRVQIAGPLGMDGQREPIGPIRLRNDTAGPVTFTIATSNAPIDDSRDVGETAVTTTVTVSGVVDVDGQAAEGAAPAGQPHRIAGTDGAALRTLRTDAEGRAVVLPVGVPAGQDLNRLVIGTDVETTLIAQVAATRHGLTGITIANRDTAATTVDLRDTTGGTVRATYTVPAGETLSFSYPVPWWAAATNTNWTAKLRAAVATNDVEISVQSFRVGY